MSYFQLVQRITVAELLACPSCQSLVSDKRTSAISNAAGHIRKHSPHPHSASIRTNSPHTHTHTHARACKASSSNAIEPRLRMGLCGAPWRRRGALLKWLAGSSMAPLSNVRDSAAPPAGGAAHYSRGWRGRRWLHSLTYGTPRRPLPAARRTTHVAGGVVDGSTL